MAERESIALSIVTGFLGAGKTTLLNRLLKDPALTDTAVIVNEFGEIAIDHFLVETAGDGVIELGGGCLCCTVRGELADTLMAVTERPQRPRRVVLETTGLADPAPVLQALAAHPVLSVLYRPEAIIAVVDAVNGASTLDTYEEARRQAALADRIVITKAELAPDGPEPLRARLAELNGEAEILDSRDSAPLTAAKLLRPGFAAGSRTPLTPSFSEAHHHHHHHTSHFSSVCLVHEGALPLLAVENFLDLVTTQQGEQILRIKGLVETDDDPDHPVLIQGARRLLHAPERLSRWPDNAPRGTRLVVIGQHLDVEYIRRIFAAFAGQAAVDTPDRKALEENPLAIAAFRPLP